MNVNVTAPVVVADSEAANTGIPGCAYCDFPGCPGTLDCYREWASSETGWRERAARPARWILANGQNVA